MVVAVCMIDYPKFGAKRVDAVIRDRKTAFDVVSEFVSDGNAGDLFAARVKDHDRQMRAKVFRAAMFCAWHIGRLFQMLM